MSNQYSKQVKTLMEKLYDLIDLLELKGLGKEIPFIDSEEGIRGTIRTDILLFVFRVTDAETVITDECVSYLEECAGISITKENAEIARKKALETELPKTCVLLPPFMAVDKLLGGNMLSSLYITTLSYFVLGYFKCQEKVSLQDMINYYKYSAGCIEIIEKGLGEKVDFNPLGSLNAEQQELIKKAVKLDEWVNSVEKDEDESNTGKNEHEQADDKDDEDFADEEYDDEEYDDEESVCSEYDIIKEDGDGSDLPDDLSNELKGEIKCLSVMEELDSMIGLTDVKQQIKAMLNVQRIQKRCKELNVRRTPISMHMVFTGNPGTGKTTVARILGKIFKESGMLSKGHFTEATRAELVGKYVGHTAVMVKEMFEKAKGGILFIDEAYALTAEGDSFGQEAIEILLKLMEDERDDIVVIVSGYPMQMQDFLESNPGLRSRFPFVIKFPDYSGDELVEIFKYFCEDNDIVPDGEVVAKVKAHFDKEASKSVRNYGNARAVRNYFDKMLMNQANRLISERSFDRDDLCRFVLNDIPQNNILADNMIVNCKAGSVMQINKIRSGI